RRCDVWAAGVVAWQLVAGRPLYPKGEDVVMGIRILNERAPSLREVVPETPPALADAIASALEHELRARCPPAEELGRRIAEAVPLASQAEVSAYVTERTEDILRERGARAAERRRQESSRTLETEKTQTAVAASREEKPAPKRRPRPL